MSLDRSLKAASNLAQHRNVLTRAERISRLTQDNEFDPTSSRVLGLRKVANRKIGGAKKVKKEPAAAGAAAPASGAAAPAAKAAAPAGKAGGKAGGKK